MTANETGILRSGWSKYSWTNAMVATLGAALTGDITIATLPAKTVVEHAFIVIGTAATGSVATLTVSCGRAAATYLDYIVASDAMAAANTLYGAVSGDLGTNLTGYDVPSWTATTVVKAHFVSTVANLSTVLTSTGSIYLHTIQLA